MLLDLEANPKFLLHAVMKFFLFSSPIQDGRTVSNRHPNLRRLHRQPRQPAGHCGLHRGRLPQLQRRQERRRAGGRGGRSPGGQHLAAGPPPLLHRDAADSPRGYQTGSGAPGGWTPQTFAVSSRRSAASDAGLL